MTEAPLWLQRYYERGFRLIFFPTKQKGPSGFEALNWPTRSDTIGQWVDGRNVGTFTGHEISPGKFLVDIDFDYPDGLPLAKHILPATGFGFGRSSRPISHAFYTTSEPLRSITFTGLDGKDIVDLRGTDKEGNSGIQTMIPPSIHPTGEELILRNDHELGHSDELPRLVALYAVACILYSNFENRAFTHDTRLATAGFLLSEGLTEQEVLKIGVAVCEASGNNTEDFKTLLASTSQKLKRGDRIQGKTSLIKILGKQGQEIISLIKKWVGSTEFIEDNKGRVLVNNQENVKIGLEKIGLSFSFDVFSYKPMFMNGAVSEGQSMSLEPLIDPIVDQAWLEIDEKFKFRPDFSFFQKVINNVAYKNQFHPVLDYLSVLTWDGIPRIDEWLIRGGKAADTPYVRAVSSIMLIAAVRRVTQPGCKYDEMVVLESSVQGLLKSTALRTLCPNEKWFSDDLPLHVDAKQIVERTLGKWIIEASDLAGKRRSDHEQLKGMLSRQTDGPVRLAYGRIPVEQPRQFIIVGTTNSYNYLSDSTGNRRFWPIRVERFDIPWLKENREQLWAEAVSREKSGESIRLDPKLYAHATMQQERRRAEDPWETKLDETFSRDKLHRLTPEDVWSPLGVPIDRQDEHSHNRILRAMEHLGFRRMTVKRPNEKAVKGFGRDVIEGQVELFEVELFEGDQ